MRHANPARDAAFEFIKAIQAASLTPPESLVPDGKLHRFASNGKRGDDSGWYVFHDDDFPAGAFGDWRSGLFQKWRADIGRALTPAEEAAHQARMDAARRAREGEKAREHAQARQNADWILECGHSASADHPYLLRKKVMPVPSLLEIAATKASEVLGYSPRSGDDLLTGRLLVAPIYVGGELSTVEFIDEVGRKSALRGGQKAGGYWSAQPLPDSGGTGLTLLIGEGVATVLSARESTGYYVAAALSSGNLKVVALQIRERYPVADLVILADLVKDTGLPDPRAIKAARAVGGRLAVPKFPEPRDPRHTDMNDLAAVCGLEVVRRAIADSKAPAVDEPKPGNGAAPSDGGQPPGDEEWPAVVARLAALPPIEYDRVREAEAKRLGIRVVTLDGEVTKARESLNSSGGVSIQGQAVVFDDPEPWPNEVDGAAVIDGAAETLSRRLSVPDGAADAMALWTVHAHCHMAFLHSPRLNITSPEKGCGKTLALDVLYSLAPKGLRTESITTAVLFRIVDKFTPTLFVDEYDAFIHDNEELRGALNAGHKRGGMHLRCEGDKNEVRGFRTFAPVALAGIRDLPGTLADRSIIIRIQRMAADEQREPFDSRRTEPEKILCRKLARWARDNFQALEAADPEMPAGAGHRVRDNWRPLFAIADRAGGDWPARVRRAFDLLAKPDDAVRSRSEMLLSDFRDLFAKHGDRILSADAVRYLAEMEERPWPEYSRGRPITARQVAAALRRFEIKPALVRAGAEVARGYVKDDFTNAFARYLPPKDPPTDPLHRYNVDGARVSEDLDPLHGGDGVTDRKPPEAKQDAGCNGVTDRIAGSDGDREVWRL